MRYLSLTFALGASLATEGASHAQVLLGAASHAQPYCADVVDQHDHPVPGAMVIVFFGASSSCGAQADDHGHFCIPVDDWQCQGGHLDVALPDAQGGRCVGGVELPDGARPPRITMPVDDRPFTQVAGRVVDERGHPIAGARVSYTSISPISGRGCSCENPATTTSNGWFSFATRPGDLDVVATADGYASRSMTFATSRRDNRIVLDRGVSWRGHVRSPDGRVLDHATLKVMDFTGIRNVPLSHGAFDLHLLAPGRKEIRIEIPEDWLLGKREEWQQITLDTEKQTVADVEFTTGLELSGTTDPDTCIWAYPERQEHDQPRSGMYVTVTADSTGRFQIHHAVPGKWVVRICKDIAMVVVDAGRSDVVIHRQ